MALRLIEMVLPETEGEKISGLLKEYKVVELRRMRLLDNELLVRILLDAEQSETVVDLLEKEYSASRVVILPVQATLHREAEDLEKKKSSERIFREELYEDIKDAAECSWSYIVMVVLSTIVAAVGLYHNSVAIIIGAMVIAPLLGPNIALSLGTTLGDLQLLRRAAKTSVAGIALAMALSILIGLFVPINPALVEVVSRTGAGIGDLAVALASGCAGALAFTTGLSAALIGVMVAVAVLPPLVVFGLLLGSGYPFLALGALSLFVMNLICVNLAGIITFLAQGIHPASWWEKDRAAKATRIAIWLWVAFLTVLIGVLVLTRTGWI